MMDKELVQRLAFLIEKAKTRCFVNDARGAYGILKEAVDLIPVEPFYLTEEEPAPDKPSAKENPRAGISGQVLYHAAELLFTKH